MTFVKLMVCKGRQVQNIPDFSDTLVVGPISEPLALLVIVVELWLNVSVNNISFKLFSEL